MSKDIDHLNNNDDIDLAAGDLSDAGMDQIMRQVQAMDAAYKIGSALANTAMVPKEYRDKPHDATAAILYGAELGLKPTQALQQIFVVQGKPAIYARTMVALLKAKGYAFETVDTSDESVTVRGTSPRGEAEEATWNIKRAEKAGYTSNKKYQTDPQAMLYAKAASEVCRKLAPDVLLGIKYTAEDLELEPVKMEARRVDAPGRGSDGLRARLALTPQQEQAEEPAPDRRDEALEKIAEATTRPELKGVMTAYTAEVVGEGYPDVHAAASQRWNELEPADQEDTE